MKELLVVVDMQNDFITGTLANPEGQKIVPLIVERINNFDGDIIVTRDTHEGNYLETQEGQRLPVVHCIDHTDGWDIVYEIQDALYDKPLGRVTYLNKPTFGALGLGEIIAKKRYDEVEICGVCTDICVISNAMIAKAYAPEAKIEVLENLCAGVTPETHKNALKAMEACQIDVVTWLAPKE